MSENKDETEQGKNVPFSPNNRNILPLLISGYRFDNAWNNFLLNTCCGIPWENLCIGKFMMDVFAPKRDSNTDMKIADNNFSLPSLPVEAHDFDEKKHTPLLFGSVFFKGQNNLLYSKQKAGKSKLSMEVAKSQLIRRPAFILREDYNDGQADDYRRIVGEKVIIVNIQKWQDVEKNIQAQKTGTANREIILQYTNPEYRNFQRISRPILARSGLLGDMVKNKDIAIFQAIVEELISQGVDLICLDSLNALLGNPTNIGRNIIESILQPMMGRGITLLLIHHENSQGNMFGSINLPASFDHNYHLELKERKDGKEILTLDEESRNTEPQSLTILRTWENNMPLYELLPETAKPSKPPSLPDRIMEALSFFDEETVLFDDLVEQLDDIKKETLKNNLKELENQGKIEKTDGKTWSNIKLKQK